MTNRPEAAIHASSPGLSAGGKDRDGRRDDEPTTWVIIPAFNASGTIGEVLAGLEPFPYRVVVVDDGSVDETSSTSDGLTTTVLRHVCNLGQGAAIQTGIDYALRQPETRYVVTFDADGQHDANDIAQLLAPLEGGEFDVALGSRFVPGGSAVDIPEVRRRALRLATMVTRVSTGLALTDTHNGLRALTARAASQMAISQNRMAHGSQILSQIAALGLRYCEVPVTVTYTSESLAKGQSLTNIVNISWEMLKERTR